MMLALSFSSLPFRRGSEYGGVQGHVGVTATPGDSDVVGTRHVVPPLYSSRVGSELPRLGATLERLACPSADPVGKEHGLNVGRSSVVLTTQYRQPLMNREVVKLRRLKGANEAEMPYRTPTTSTVVERLMDAQMAIRDAFRRDGAICETEQRALDALRAALRLAERADHQRVEAIYALNFGLEEPPSQWHKRKRREMDERHGDDEAA